MGSVIFFRLRVFDQRNVPARGGVLIVSNHQSYLDPVLLSLGLKRPISFMARRTLFRFRPFGRLISALNAFPVTREGVDTAAMREAIRRLREGWCLLVFAEGTRTQDGTIGVLRPGILMVAERADVPIVPAVIDGAYEAWPRAAAPRPGQITIVYGRAISREERHGHSREELAGRLQTELLRLKAEAKKRRSKA
jgi:1-acyl-sn-glycerol-3-phosphate acyltransferase